MKKRTFGQFCGVARALELVGERWALLIVRDLILSPKRFTDLRRGLPRIPTNILSTRLKEMEEAGIIQRRILPRPEGAVVYDLTEYGRELEDVVLQFGRWGAKSLGEPTIDDVMNLDSLLLALRATFQPENARGESVSFEIHLGDMVVYAVIEDGSLDVGEGELPGADLVIEPQAALKALMAGDLAPRDAIEGELINIHGNPDLLERFAEFFQIHPCHRASS